MPPSRQTLETLYQVMVRIRRFDERTVELFNAGHVKGTAHSYVGQEAVATGACAHLTKEDSVISNHRGHGHCIAKGARLDLMMAELMGREDGYCRGLGGSMHIAALDLNMLGANGIVAAGVPIGAGAALAAKLRGTGRVVLSFFGDGGANQGVVHETMNLAAVWKLPFIFVCENNKYALSTDQSRTTAGEGVSARARAYGIPAARVDGNDLVAVYDAVGEAVARARRGEGPSCVEAVTYRWGGHSMRANLPEYRTKQEELEWMEKDPIARVERRLLDMGGTDIDLKEMRQRVEGELEAAVAYGIESPEPTVEIMEAAVYSPHARVVEPVSRAGRELITVEGVWEDHWMGRETVLALSGRALVSVEIEGQLVGVPSLLPQELAAHVGGQPPRVTSLTAPGPFCLSVPLSPDDAPSGRWEVSLTPSRTFCPMEEGLSGDSRHLSVQLLRVRARTQDGREIVKTLGPSPIEGGC